MTSFKLSTLQCGIATPFPIPVLSWLSRCIMRSYNISGSENFPVSQIHSANSRRMPDTVVAFSSGKITLSLTISDNFMRSNRLQGSVSTPALIFEQIINGRICHPPYHQFDDDLLHFRIDQSVIPIFSLEQ